MDLVFHSNISFKDENEEGAFPGYTLHTPNFSLQFVSASQQGKRSPILEMETDWKEVMMIMLTALEIENGKTRNTEKLIKEKIEA